VLLYNWLASFVLLLSFYLLTAQLPVYVQSLGISHGAIGIIIGCLTLISMLLKPFAGWGTDRFGRRPLMLAGALIFVVSSLGYGWSRTVGALVIVRLLHGCGMGLYPTAASAVVADVSPSRRLAELIGLYSTSGALAMAAGPLIGVAVVRRYGFPLLFVSSAALAVLAILLIVPIEETLKQRISTPFRFSSTLCQQAAFPSLIIFFVMLTFGAQFAFVPIYANERRMNPGLFFLVLAVVIAFARLLGGRFSDRLGRRRPTLVGLVIVAIALTELALGGDGRDLMIAAGLFGIGFGIVDPALRAWCLDGIVPQNRGRAMGTYLLAYDLGFGVGAVVAGFAVDRVGFTATFLGGAAVALSAGILVLMRREIEFRPGCASGVA